jgi:hypothetical protein
MSGAVPLLLLYAFMARTVQILPLGGILTEHVGSMNSAVGFQSRPER